MKIEEDTVLVNEISATMTVPVIGEIDDETFVENAEVHISIRSPKLMAGELAVALSALMKVAADTVLIQEGS